MILTMGHLSVVLMALYTIRKVFNKTRPRYIADLDLTGRKLK
jgi:hypothetical protein